MEQKPMTDFERFVQDEEGQRLFQQERLILEVTELLHAVMEEKDIKRAALAKMLGRSRGRITQILDGTENLTLRTVADAFTAMGKMLCIKARDIAETEEAFELHVGDVAYPLEGPTLVYKIKIDPPTAYGASDEVALAG